jgi:hypothetical protein
MAVDFTDFTTSGNFSSDNYLVGYDVDASGGEKKWKYSTLLSSVTSNFSPTIDAKLSNYLPLSGGTLTGMLNVLSVTETKQTPLITANTLTLNLGSAVVFHVNLNCAISTFTLTNVPASPRVYSFALQLSADGTSRSVVWPTGTRWSGGSAPTLTTTAGKVDTFTFLTHDGGTSWFGFTNDQNQ